jgi:hypothetical protein
LLSGVPEQPSLDETTSNWPVPDNMKDQLKLLMPTHMAQPLPVYDKDAYVEPSSVNNAIRNALVEVHFTLKHHHIQRKDGSKALDSFSGRIEQIIILKPGVPLTMSGYKRKNLLDGPYCPKPFVVPASVPPPAVPTALTGEVASVLLPATKASTSGKKKA